MKADGFLPRLYRGLREHPYRSLANLVLAFTASWAILEPVVSLFSLDSIKSETFGGLVLVSVITALYKSALPRSVSIKMPGLRKPLKLSFGDLFLQEMDKAIPVNEFFDGEIGSKVSEGTVHGQCIAKYFNGDGTKFETLVDDALQGRPSSEDHMRAGRNRKYPIGTVAFLSLAGTDFSLYATALAMTDPTNHKATADIDDVVTSVRELCRCIRVFGNGRPVAIPLFGGGASGIKVSFKALLHLLVISILREARDANIDSQIHIVLHPNLSQALDLSEYRYTSWE